MRPVTRERLEAYWARRLGVDSRLLGRPGFHVESGRTGSPERLYIVDVDGAVIALAPERWATALRAERQPRRLVEREVVARLLPADARLIGPAFIGYADEVASQAPAPSEMESTSDAAFDALRRAASDEEWAHAGLDDHAPPLFVELVGDDVVAAAGFEVLADEVAHIGVLAHPAHRGAGGGRRVVAGAARHALSRGLLAQYQTLHANTPALAIAHTLGFGHFATTMAARLPPST